MLPPGFRMPQIQSAFDQQSFDRRNWAPQSRNIGGLLAADWQFHKARHCDGPLVSQTAPPSTPHISSRICSGFRRQGRPQHLPSGRMAPFSSCRPVACPAQLCGRVRWWQLINLPIYHRPIYYRAIYYQQAVRLR